MHKIKRILFFTVSFSLVAMLSACGSKGDLYHEEQEKPQLTKEQEEQKTNAHSQPQPEEKE